MLVGVAIQQRGHAVATILKEAWAPEAAEGEEEDEAEQPDRFEKSFEGVGIH